MSHAIFSPSSLGRILQCPASVDFNPSGDNDFSIPAFTGTVIHDLAERILSFKYVPNIGYYACDDKPVMYVNYKPIVGDYVQITQDMLNTANDYVNFINSHYDKNNFLFIEDKVSINDYCYGTADAIILKKDRVIVVDLKTGYVAVCAENNKQLMAYALGFANKLDNPDAYVFEIVIWQNGFVDIAEYTMQDLLEFESKIETAYLLATLHNDRVINAENPSESACKYCKKITKCEAVNKLTKESLLNATQPLYDLPNALDWIERNEKTIINYFDTVKKEAFNNIINGGLVEGFKLIHGRNSAAKWLDESDYEFLPENLRFEQKRISPAQVILADKSLKDVIAEKVVVSETKPQLVRFDKPGRVFAKAGVSIDDFN
jgi:hypothetical protein